MKEKVDLEKKIEKYNRPLYLASFIYAYARGHLYDHILSRYDVLYMDTDSALMTK